MFTRFYSRITFIL